MTLMNNQVEPISLATLMPPNMPAPMRREFEQQLQIMENVTQAVILGMRGVNVIYKEAVMTSLITVQQMMLMKMNILGATPNQTVDIWVDHQIENLLIRMEQIPEQACEQVLNVLGKLQTDTQDVPLIDELIDIFLRRLRR